MFDSVDMSFDMRSMAICRRSDSVSPSSLSESGSALTSSIA
jgi:hypothetical protein